MKHCTKCQILKDKKLFSKDSGNPDGLYAWCKDCVHLHQVLNKQRIRMKQNEWRKKNADYVKKYSSEYELNNKAMRAISRKIRRDLHPEITKHKSLQRTFGITFNDFTKMKENQNFVCAICKKPETAKHKNKIRELAVDHDHKTGKIRQLLCHQCNSGLGNFKDDINLLYTAIKYLEKHNVSN